MLALSPLLLVFILLMLGLLLYLGYLSKWNKYKLLSASNFNSKELYIDGRCFLLVPAEKIAKMNKRVITIKKFQGLYCEIDEISYIILRKIDINSLPNDIIVYFIDSNEFYQPK